MTGVTLVSELLEFVRTVCEYCSACVSRVGLSAKCVSNRTVPAQPSQPFGGCQIPL